MDEPIKFFIHIPKTAGLTMQRILAAEYPGESMVSLHDVPDSERLQTIKSVSDEVRAVAGHISFGAADCLPRHARPFTILREPVDRIVSLYHFLKREKAVVGHEKVVQGKLTLTKLAQKQGDHQARYIAGYGPKDDVEPGRLVVEAQQNLTEKLAAFGLTERFDESLVLFQRTFGWRLRGYARQNVTSNRPSVASYSEEQITEIRRHSTVDIEFYKFARREFDRRISTQPPEFARAVRSLRRRIFARNGLRRIRSVVVHVVNTARGN